MKDHREVWDEAYYAALDAGEDEDSAADTADRAVEAYVSSIADYGGDR